jgi:predicted O-methyltransferase YrrM
MITFEQVMLKTGNCHATATLMDNEAKLLYDCCLTIPKGGIMVEIGCQLGRSSSLISQLSYDIGFDCIHVDPYTRQPGWMKEWMGMMYKLGPLDHQRFSLLCMRTEQAERILDRIGTLDMAYIDGDHERDSALTDLRIVANKVKPGGLLCVHDYSPDQMPVYSFQGVVEAMDIYLKSGLWEKVEQAGEMGAWRRK